MELVMICLAVVYMFTSKHSKDTAQAAYKAGKEPPGLVKARLRHESGGGLFGGLFGRSPGGQRRADGKPKGHGATRLRVASRWANACHKAKVKGEDRLARWEAWYREQAPERDERWREKQRKRLDRANDRVERWQDRWTSTKEATGRAASRAKDAISPTARQTEDEAWNQNAVRDVNNTIAEGNRTEDTQPDTEATADEQASEDIPGQNDSAETGEAAASPAVSGGTATATSGIDTTGGTTVYQQGAAQLHNHADEVEGYMRALSMLGDELESLKWGAEVHGPLSDMHTELQQVVGRYRDLAEQVKAQGDNVNDAYDDVPWAPDREAVMQ